MSDEKYRVLILDDDFELGELLKEYLQNTTKCAVTYINSEPEFWDLIRRESYDILFLDYKLAPNANGLDILARMGQAGYTIPTVMMTGEGSENIAARAIQSGALDYLVKGEYSFSALPPLIQKAVRLREMQRAMQQYLEQIRFQSMLLDHMRDAVVVWGLDGRITYWNAAAEQLYGTPAADRLDKGVADTYFPLFDPPISAEELAGAGSHQLERRFQLADGEKIWVSAHITGLYGEGSRNEPIGFMNVARDITPLKTAQTHLAQAARLASIGELASGVAHQISNPLTTIIGDAQILLHQLEREHPGRESAEAIIQAGWRTQQVINELMKFSQPTNATFELISINETIDAALLLAGAHIQAFGVELQVELAPDLPAISGNPRQLSDLWVNLLLLARTAFVDGKAHNIWITSRRSRSCEIQVEITDDGIPILPEQYDKIFEPQLIPAGAGRGTGIELSICRELVRQNRGKISVSNKGAETTFQITFTAEGM
jgi:PAS domain S-box-containing protein